MQRREFVHTLAASSAAMQVGSAQGSVTKYVRFRKGNTTGYGILRGDTVHAISGSLFGAHKETSAKHKLSDVKLLYPCEASKVLALAGNYKSHMGGKALFVNPEIFYKPVTCLQHPDDSIVIPKGSVNLHYEGELVVVIGKTAKNVSVEEAKAAIFGVTCGNDVSERDWQNGAKKDVQWWRAKGADTFGPLGPVIARGVNYGNLLLQTRLNGQVVQKENTSDLLFDCPTMVSFISKYVTLAPGDLIFTGTPQTTKKMSPGDTVEVDIEGIGVLTNKVVAG
jgi:2-keto-4-pentenoate hydratase/2-oxohepta-3-ene-1,7-dioic acid hydratase in catechol pathway